VEYIRGFTRDVVIAIMANIEGKELRCQNNKIGHPEHQHTEVTEYLKVSAPAILGHF